MIVHLQLPGWDELDPAPCGEQYGVYSSSPGEVTCWRCRKTSIFRTFQLGGGPPPPTNNDIPTLLRRVIADCESMLALHEQAQRITTHESEI